MHYSTISLQCAFKSQCFSLVVLDALTDEEKKILDSNAASRRKMLDCRLKRLGCNSLATASQQCPYIACKPCCQEQKKLCLTHGEREWSQLKLYYQFVFRPNSESCDIR